MNVTYEATILCNDCDLLFQATDETGRRYIAVHTGDYETGCHYMMAPASPESLADFKNGKIDLRRLLLDCPTQEWYTAALDANDDDAAIALRQQDTPISRYGELPGAGFYIGVGASREIVQEDVSPQCRRTPPSPASSKTGYPSTRSP